MHARWQRIDFISFFILIRKAFNLACNARVYISILIRSQFGVINSTLNKIQITKIASRLKYFTPTHQSPIILALWSAAAAITAAVMMMWCILFCCSIEWSFSGKLALRARSPTNQPIYICIIVRANILLLAAPYPICVCMLFDRMYWFFSLSLPLLCSFLLFCYPNACSEYFILLNIDWPRQIIQTHIARLSRSIYIVAGASVRRLYYECMIYHCVWLLCFAFCLLRCDDDNFMTLSPIAWTLLVFFLACFSPFSILCFHLSVFTVNTRYICIYMRQWWRLIWSIDIDLSVKLILIKNDGIMRDNMETNKSPAKYVICVLDTFWVSIDDAPQICMHWCSGIFCNHLNAEWSRDLPFVF